MTLMTALDLLLLLGLTLRLTRLITTDDLGAWWVRWPLDSFKHDWMQRHYEREPRWAKYLDGLECPFCVGFHIGWLATLSLWLVGGPGDAADWWRYGAGIFALNYVAGHIAARLD